MEKLTPVLPPLSAEETIGYPMRDYIVAVRHQYDSLWPARHIDRIEMAREAYDKGVCELTQGRFHEHFVLFAIPRRQRAPSRFYFTQVGFALI